jgi:hypothetical protein
VGIASHRFWIYWAAIITLTLLVLGIWAVWVSVILINYDVEDERIGLPSADEEKGSKVKRALGRSHQCSRFTGPTCAKDSSRPREKKHLIRCWGSSGDGERRLEKIVLIWSCWASGYSWGWYAELDSLRLWDNDEFNEFNAQFSSTGFIRWVYEVLYGLGLRLGSKFPLFWAKFDHIN